MRILFTNNTLAERAGTELFVRDLAVAFARLGHHVGAYSQVLGPVADELRAEGVFVSDRLPEFPWEPEVIHGHHHLETMTSLLFFPNTPAIFVSHGWIPWVEIPPLHPRIREYFGVDRPTLEAAVQQHQIPADRLRILPKFVDLARFEMRAPLPDKPRRALVLSNYAREETHLPFIREACAKTGIELDLAGLGIERVVERPEDILRNYDLVFAKGRSALEGVCVGSAVIVCDAFGVGPMVTTENAMALHTLNGAYETFYEPLSVEGLLREIGKYDPRAAAQVCQLARATVGIEHALTTLTAAYQNAISGFAAAERDHQAERAAESSYLAWIARYTKDNPAASRQHDALSAGLEEARSEAVRLKEALDTQNQSWVHRAASYFSPGEKS
jgi:hypothetical protein